MRCLKSVLAATAVICCYLTGPVGISLAEDSSTKASVETIRVWDQGKHQAFTDLVFYKGKWLLTFREGAGHVSGDGGLRILSSSNGQDWTPAAFVQMADFDLRDPHFCVTPEGKLMLYGVAAIHKPRTPEHMTYAWFSDDGINWSEPHPIGEKDYWMWRIEWHNGTAYGVAYRCNTKIPAEQILRLYKSVDGTHFEVVVDNMGMTSYPNESAILFDKDGTAHVVLRRDGMTGADGQLGTAKPPYTEWKWESLDVRIGGPQALELPDGRIVVASRKYGKTSTTNLFWLDLKSHSLTEFAELPSGGDTSYPGLVFRDGTLWVSYYASHEGKTNIYLSRVKLPQQK